jgi:hypothetical protein
VVINKSGGILEEAVIAYSKTLSQGLRQKQDDVRVAGLQAEFESDTS